MFSLDNRKEIAIGVTLFFLGLFFLLISCAHGSRSYMTRTEKDNAVAELELIWQDWSSSELTLGSYDLRRMAIIENYQDDWEILHNRWARTIMIGNIDQEDLALRALVHFVRGTSRKEAELAAAIFTASINVYNLFALYGPPYPLIFDPTSLQ